jgi:NADH pyrophosphatase NudC (nudix superfamily)
MWEETGLWITPIRIVGVYGGPAFHWVYSNGDEIAYQMTVFEGRVRSGQLRAEEDELLELAYFSAEEAHMLATPAWVPVVLADAFQHHQHASFQAASWQPPPERE